MRRIGKSPACKADALKSNWGFKSLRQHHKYMKRLDESFSWIGFLKALYGPDFEYPKHAGIKIALDKLSVDKNGQIQLKTNGR